MSCQALITLSVGACREAQGALCNLPLPARLKFQAGVGLSHTAVMLVPGSPGEHLHSGIVGVEGKGCVGAALSARGRIPTERGAFSPARHPNTPDHIDLTPTPLWSLASESELGTLQPFSDWPECIPVPPSPSPS